MIRTMMKLMTLLSLSLLVSGCGTLTDTASDAWKIEVNTSMKADECTAECDATLQKKVTMEDEEAINHTRTIEALKGKAVP